MKIPLFDIDGTLFKTANPVHYNAFSYAFKTVYGLDAKQDDNGSPEGRTDSQIIIEIMNFHGIKPEDSRKKIKPALQAMSEYFEKHKDQVNPEIIPGVKQLLSKLKEKSIPMGVLTGNVEEIAWTKIEKAGLRDFFDFGAFGDKTEVRAELVEIARKNAETTLGKSFKTEDFVIVGDTPRDVKCARDTGIKVIIASTGTYSFQDLEQEKPDLLVHTLEDKRVFDYLTS